MYTVIQKFGFNAWKKYLMLIETFIWYSNIANYYANLTYLYLQYILKCNLFGKAEFASNGCVAFI